MDPSNTEEPEALPTVVFGRAGKKRKAYRQRGAAESTPTDEPIATAQSPEKTDITAQETATPTEPRPTSADNDEKTIPEKDGDAKDGPSDDSAAEDEGEDEDDAAGISVAELIRRRKTRKPKIGGVGFRDEDTEPSSSSTALSRYADMAVDDMDLDFASDPMAMGVQFVPQTGMIGELVNKHMEEYVDAQLAKRHRAEAEQASLQPGGPSGSISGSGAGLGAGASGTGPSVESRQQLAMKGKLHEIDLGAEARAKNVAMTERATQRLRGADDAGNPSEGGAPSSGRNGKRRRGSDDIKRDQMVEQFLHENRMDVDVYDVSRDAAAAASTATTAEGRPTDDRIAEQFRREFMEAVAQRMRRKRKPLGPPAKPKTARNDEEVLRGPKLGGSRNVRSVMRDKLLQKQEEERHNMPKYEQQLQEQKRRMNRRR